MNIAPYRHGSAANLASGVAVTAATAIVFGVVLGPGHAGTSPWLAGFLARSYAPGQIAVLAIRGGDTTRATLQIFQTGASGTPGPAAAPGWDKHTFGKPVTTPQLVRRPAGSSRWLVRVRLGSSWASGDYVARLSWGARTDYAPFVLPPSRLGRARVRVVERRNTWHASDAVAVDRVKVSRNTRTGRRRWRDLARPEAALVGAQSAGWDEGKYPNRPYRIVNTAAAPWLFEGTALHNGSAVGNYGIEVDEPSAVSPPHTHVLAEIPNELGPGKPAEMTIYTRGRSTVFDAGAINFGASAHWPALSRFFSNLWSHLSGESSDS